MFFMSDRTACGELLAIERTLVPAWLRICDRVMLAVSAAKSVSRMVDSADVMLSRAVASERAWDSRVFFWRAPRRPRRLLTWSMALEIIEAAAVKLLVVRALAAPVVRLFR